MTAIIPGQETERDLIQEAIDADHKALEAQILALTKWCNEMFERDQRGEGITTTERIAWKVRIGKLAALTGRQKLEDFNADKHAKRRTRGRKQSVQMVRTVLNEQSKGTEKIAVKSGRTVR